MKSVSTVGEMSSMAVIPEPGFDKDYGDLLLSMCIKVLAQALAALPALYFSVLPRLKSTNSSVAGKQASFAMGICEAEASGRNFDEPCLASELSNTEDDFSGPEGVAISKAFEAAVEGPETSKRMRRKDISAWLALAKNKDDDDEDDDEEDEDDDEDDEDDAADEGKVGDEGEGEEEVEGHGDGGGEDDDDDDDDDDENGKGGDDEEDEEDAVEGEDDEDDDAAEDEEDEDEDDDDDETPEPPQKKRK